MKLILLTLALVCFLLSAAVPVGWLADPYRARLAYAGLAFWVLSQYPL